MNRTPSPDPIISSAAPFKSYNYVPADDGDDDDGVGGGGGSLGGGGGRNADGSGNSDDDDNNEVPSENMNIQRYSRSTLYLLRHDNHSRRRPECSLRAELQSLGVWKFATANFNQNGNHSVNMEGGGQSITSSSSQLLHTRAQRSPSTRAGSSGNASDHHSSNPSSTHSLAHHNSMQKTYIDHRSISSSHLMPAFAKRRIIATCATPNVNNSDNGGCGNSSYGGNSPPELLNDTLSESKDTSYTSRPRGKDNHLYGYRTRSGGDNNFYLSPHRNSMGEHNKDRLERPHDHDHSGSTTSPVAVVNTRHGHQNILHERRIGSGRLLPRDVNWDYRGQEKDKNNVTGPSSISEKETSVSSHVLQQQRGGGAGRYASERNHHERGNNTFIERRSFERRVGATSNDSHTRDMYDMNKSSSPSTHTRRFAENDMTSNTEMLQQHHHQQHQQQQQSLHGGGRNRRNHQFNNHHHNEEPEWFSGGPTSQHDTIELHGFEEIDDNCSSSGAAGGSGKMNHVTRKLSESSSSRASSILSLSLSQKTKEHAKDNALPTAPDNDMNCNSETSVMKQEDGETKNEAAKNNHNNNNNCDDGSERQLGEQLLNAIEKDRTTCGGNAAVSTAKAEFNFEAYFNLDPLEHSLMPVGESQIGNDAAIVSSSRFSRWFANDNNGDNVQLSSNGNEIRHEEDLNRMKNRDETITLMEFLQSNKMPAPADGPHHNVSDMPSVEELEARMRKMDSCGGDTPMVGIEPAKHHHENPLFPVLTVVEQQKEQKNHQTSAELSPPTQDMEAFKKLLEQLGTANKQQQLFTVGSLPLLPQQQSSNRSQSIPPNTAQLNMISAGTAQWLPPPKHILKPDEIKFIQQHQQQQQQKHMQHIVTAPISPQQSHHHHLPINELQTAIPYNNSPPAFAAQLSQHKRMEAQHLMQCVARGDVSLNSLEHDLNNPATPAHTKDVIAAVLRESANSGTVSNMPPALPQPIINTSGVHLQHQQIQSPITINGPPTVPPQQQQHCLSNTNMTIANALMNNTGALLVPGQPDGQCIMAPGLHSPRDIQFHTQNIMPNALLKKKIEEQQQQQDALKRRQNIQKQQHQSNIIIPVLPIQLQAQTNNPTQTNHALQNQQQQQQQARHVNSPTPLAFTPTSVLRKMTAEKENTNSQQQSASNQQQSASNQQQPQNKSLAQSVFVNQQQQIIQQPLTQPRMILGGNHPQQQQQQPHLNNGGGGGLQNSPQQVLSQLRNVPQVKWPPTHMMNQNNMSANKPMGRPILKGPLPILPMQQQPPPPPHQQQMGQMTFASKIEFQQIQQQQQRLKNNQTPQHVLNQPSTQIYTHAVQQQQPPPSSPGQSTVIAHMQQQQQQLFQQQQRTLALQRQQVQMCQQLNHQNQPHPHHSSMDANIRTIDISTNNSSNSAVAAAENSSAAVINYQRDGGLSPTSNQLAQWFSPELLAQASAGKLPLLNMNQALSLEEFERSIQHSSTAVHN